MVNLHYVGTFHQGNFIEPCVLESAKPYVSGEFPGSFVNNVLTDLFEKIYNQHIYHEDASMVRHDLESDMVICGNMSGNEPMLFFSISED